MKGENILYFTHTFSCIFRQHTLYLNEYKYDLVLVSAWNDGIIRVFGFDGKSNNDIKLLKAISAAHNKGVTAVACTKNASYCSPGQWDFNIVSGGGEGQVRIWAFKYDGRGDPSYSLIDTLKEHKGSVSDIKIRCDDRECVSASTDGTCIIWNLEWVPVPCPCVRELKVAE